MKSFRKEQPPKDVKVLVRYMTYAGAVYDEMKYTTGPGGVSWFENDSGTVICISSVTHWDYMSNAGGEGREPCERTSPPPCSASPVAQPPRDVSELYHELLYAVARKFPGESRHETALRYIRDTEERAGQAGSCKQNKEFCPAKRGRERQVGT